MKYLHFFVQDELSEFIKKNCTSETKKKFKNIKTVNDLLDLISDWNEVQVVIRGGNGYSENESTYCLGNCYFELTKKDSNVTNYTSNRIIKL